MDEHPTTSNEPNPGANQIAADKWNADNVRDEESPVEHDLRTAEPTYTDPNVNPDPTINANMEPQSNPTMVQSDSTPDDVITSDPELGEMQEADTDPNPVPSEVEPHNFRQSDDDPTVCADCNGEEHTETHGFSD